MTNLPPAIPVVYYQNYNPNAYTFQPEDKGSPFAPVCLGGYTVVYWVQEQVFLIQRGESDACASPFR